MALRWSCFLSFRGGKGDLASGIVDLFAQALANELELQVDAGLYRYTEEMVAGDVVDPTLLEALNDSACMILLFTGKYFSKAHLYCAREYLTMVRLEKVRLELLAPDARPKKGLILPVILRNLERCPPDLRTRFWFDFTEFEQKDDGISKPKKFFSDVRKIAAYVVERYYELDDAMGEAREKVELPDDDEVAAFVAAMARSLRGKATKKAKGG